MLRERQPWKAAYEQDYGWLGHVLAEHYAGDDPIVRVLLGGVLAAHSGISVDEFEAAADSFLRTTQRYEWLTVVGIKSDWVTVF